MKDARFASARSAGTKPRFVCFYGKATPYARAPIKAIKEQAALLGSEVGPDQDVPRTALDAKSQVLAAKDFKPDLVWHGDTVNGVATALKDAKALGLGADHIVNTYGFDENLPKYWPCFLVEPRVNTSTTSVSDVVDVARPADREDALAGRDVLEDRSGETVAFGEGAVGLAGVGVVGPVGFGAVVVLVDHAPG